MATRTTETVIQYFRSRANQKCDDGCWEWSGTRMAKGYGQFRHPDYPRSLAHRAAWMLFVGPIPLGINVCHRCDNPRCVNPNHLFLGTQAQNLEDAKVKGRLKNPNRGGNQRKTHCPQGHSYADAYHYIVDGYNTRVCRTCAVEKSRKYRAMKTYAFQPPEEAKS